ncbi:MAG: HAMP domain-containing sensor histidine kinase [Bacteroidota bacterium]|nr:HAMP domain-containing sensor histidine kinase [Bacteroidota bacterium]
MKLQFKLSIFNAATKILIIGLFVLFIPRFIDKTAVKHSDRRLIVQKEKVMSLVDRMGIRNFIKEEQDSTFARYNILKEEFVSIEPIPQKVNDTLMIKNSYRNLEDEVVEYRVLSYVFCRKNQFYLLEIGRSLHIVDELNKTLIWVAFGILFFTILITTIIDLGITRFLLNPFFQIIQRKVKRIRHPDTFNFEPIKTTTSDFRYLDTSLNQMMLQIKEAFETEREFIVNVSHELLTPISILQSKLENVLSDPNLSEENGKKVLDSLRSLHRLNKVTRALLLISRIENQQFTREDVVSIPRLVDEVVEEIEERATLQDITIDQNQIEPFSLTNCNRSLLFTLLINLVNNSIKYNKSHGKVLICGRIVNGQYLLSVEDTGIGIASENIDTIFNRFKKYNAIREESHGLGLSIVRSIIDFHHYTIEVKSIPHKGSVFTVVIPVE